VAAGLARAPADAFAGTALTRANIGGGDDFAENQAVTASLLMEGMIPISVSGAQI
jgi:hypothetical protein